MRQTFFRFVAAAITAALCMLAAPPVFAQALEPKEDPTDEDIEKAKQHMAAGVAFIQDPDGPRYEEAYPEFEKAYRLSGSINALHNLAISAMHLELDGEAIKYYERVLEQKGDDLAEEERKQIETDLNRLKATTAWVTLSADEPGVTVTDVRTPRRGDPVRNKYDIGLQQQKLGIHPGSHVFTARMSDGTKKVWEVEIENGERLNHEFVFNPDKPVTADGFTEEDQEDLVGGGAETPSPDPDPGKDEAGEGGMPAYVWAVMGVTIAAGITWGAMMGVSASKKGEYDDEILGQAPLAEQQSAADELQTINIVADVMLGVTAAGAVTTIVLALTADTGGEEEATAETDEPQLGVDYTVAPMIHPDGRAMGAAVTTRF